MGQSNAGQRDGFLFKYIDTSGPPRRQADRVAMIELEGSAAETEKTTSMHGCAGQ